MLLTITTTRAPATDLGYLLHKHTDRLQSFDVSAGQAHVFYPEATPERCTAALLLEVDPIALVRGPAGTNSKHGRHSDGELAQYVNDRPYAASSMLAVAIKEAFRTALTGRCDARPGLAAERIPLTIRVPALRCRGGEPLAHRVFAPLGWRLDARSQPLRPAGWGDSPYLDLRLTGELRLADALNHLYVLLPVLDDAKHYWVSTPSTPTARTAWHPCCARRSTWARARYCWYAARQMMRKPVSACPAPVPSRPGPGGRSWPRSSQRHCSSRAGLFDELGTSWLLLDAELLPWNVKAGSLLRDQYAAVGAAALASLPAAVSVLEQACARGLPEGHPLRGHCLRGHCPGSAPCWSVPRPGWPTRRRSPPPTCATAGPPTGWPGVRVAPFQLLASEGAVYHERPHLWHLGLANRLAAAAPQFLATTRRVELETGDPASVAAATRWWGPGGPGPRRPRRAPLARPRMRLRRLGPGVRTRRPPALTGSGRVGTQHP